MEYPSIKALPQRITERENWNAMECPMINALKRSRTPRDAGTMLERLLTKIGEKDVVRLQSCPLREGRVGRAVGPTGQRQ